MKHLLARALRGAAALIFALTALYLPANAAVNPLTGDPSERIMGWVFIALGVSLIAVIVLFIVLGKNRKD